MEEVLLKPLKEQQGIKSLVFIDACAADLKTSVEQARDMVSDLTPMEFEALVQSTDHAAAFFACSPNEKAYPSDALMHGIWTYHLIQALQGDVEGALDRDRFITGESLKKLSYGRSSRLYPREHQDSSGTEAVRHPEFQWPFQHSPSAAIRQREGSIPCGHRSQAHAGAAANADQWEPASDHAVGNRGPLQPMERRRLYIAPSGR